MRNLPKSLGLLIIPIIYSLFIPLNQPNYAHASITLGLLGLIGYLCSIELKYRPTNVHNTELIELQGEYQREQLKTNIDQIKSTRARSAALKDEFGAGGDLGKFKF